MSQQAHHTSVYMRCNSNADLCSVLSLPTLLVFVTERQQNDQMENQFCSRMDLCWITRRHAWLSEQLEVKENGNDTLAPWQDPRHAGD